MVSALCDPRIYGNLIEFAQIFSVHPLQTLCHIHISIQENIAVGRMIVFAMECQEVFISQIRDAFRISTGLYTIRGIRKQHVENLTFQHFFGG